MGIIYRRLDSSTILRPQTALRVRSAEWRLQKSRARRTQQHKHKAQGRPQRPANNFMLSLPVPILMTFGFTLTTNETQKPVKSTQFKLHKQRKERV